ncbi:MAG: hypothetical protein AABY15_04120 [Nanoarchaeota archaeon]
MELNELEALRGYNELDLLHKLIEIAQENKKRTEQFLKGNKTAGVDVRHSMQDVRLLAEFIREAIQVKKGTKQPDTGKYKGKTIPLTKLEKAIIDKKESIEKEEIFIKRAENLRKSKRKQKVD